jgi:hypothetical protein
MPCGGVFPFEDDASRAETAFMENQKNGASDETFYFKYAHVRSFRATVRVQTPSAYFNRQPPMFRVKSDKCLAII